MANKRTATKAKTPTKQRQIPMVWNFPVDLVSGYATNMLVQTGESELYVSFFEAPPPVLFGPEDAKKLESFTAECIARLVISPDRMAKFIEVLQQQLNAFNEKKKAKKSSAQ
jgi:hypothetical protein